MQIPGDITISFSASIRGFSEQGTRPCEVIAETSVINSWIDDLCVPGCDMFRSVTGCRSGTVDCKCLRPAESNTEHRPRPPAVIADPRGHLASR